MGAGDRRSPLLELHTELGAKLTEFAGWQMPLQYEGIIAEHNAVRNDAGLFDVSHLGKLRVAGEGTRDALQEALTVDVAALPVGRATYSLVLEDDAGCIDDVFVYRVDESEWLVVPNAANVGAVAEAIARSGGSPVDEWDRWAILALQGPRSFAVFEKAFPGTGASELELHAWRHMEIDGVEAMVARTGYTGERGFEIYAPAEASGRCFRALIAAGARPVGLGARDTLRLEMGYALYGHELSRSINPLEAGLGWAVAWETPFRGRKPLEDVRASGPRRRLFGIRCTDKGVPRQHYEVFVGDRAVGEVTSGNYSPTLACGIALALGPAKEIPEPGETAEVDARGRRIQGDIVKQPFIKR